MSLMDRLDELYVEDLEDKNASKSKYIIELEEKVRTQKQRMESMVKNYTEEIAKLKNEVKRLNSILKEEFIDESKP